MSAATIASGQDRALTDDRPVSLANDGDYREYWYRKVFRTINAIKALQREIDAAQIGAAGQAERQLESAGEHLEKAQDELSTALDRVIIIGTLP